MYILILARRELLPRRGHKETHAKVPDGIDGHVKSIAIDGCSGDTTPTRKRSPVT